MKKLWGFLTLVSIVGCGQTFTSQKTQQQQVAAVAPFDVNRYPANKLVCDPFGGGGATSYDQGLSAKLFYLKSGQVIPHNVADMISQGAASSNDLFFSQVNVPTRLFNTGFPTETGGIVKDDLGHELIEYFGLRFEGGLRLTESDSEGTYEFALLSDDGAILSVNAGESFTPLVQNDGDHPTKMGCGNTLNFTRESQYKIRLDYYQGPRYHISVIPLWRKINEVRLSEAQCGQLGNEMYFDYNQASKPQAAYLNLLLRGWKPIASGNYSIPKSAAYNPCVQGEAPRISNFTARVENEGRITASWVTDIPATTQLLYTDISTGVQTLTTADNTLTLEHTVSVVAPVAFGYDTQGVSVSESMGRAMSPVVRVNY